MSYRVEIRERLDDAADIGGIITRAEQMPDAERTKAYGTMGLDLLRARKAQLIREADELSRL